MRRTAVLVRGGWGVPCSDSITGRDQIIRKIDISSRDTYSTYSFSLTEVFT